MSQKSIVPIVEGATNPLNISCKSDVSSVCDDDQPLLASPSRRSYQGLGMFGTPQQTDGDVYPLSARGGGANNVPHSGGTVPNSARARSSSILYLNKKNRTEILTQKLEKMEEFFRKSNAKANTRFGAGTMIIHHTSV